MNSFGINKVTLLGRLGCDPRVRHSASGDLRVYITLATNEQWHDNSTSAIKCRTEWHEVVFFGQPAEVAEAFLKKGTCICIEGQIRNHSWKDQSGQLLRRTEIIVARRGALQIVNLSIRRGAPEQESATTESSPPDCSDF